MSKLSQVTPEYPKLLDALLARYARDRAEAQKRLVGQFLDREAVASQQLGIYGMAAYAHVSRDSRDIDVCGLREACLDQLEAWAIESQDYTLSTEEASTGVRDVNSNLYEIRHITPKAVYAYTALSRRPESEGAKALLGYIKKGQNRADGGFSYHLDSNGTSHVYPTSLAARALSVSNPPELMKALKYLYSNYANSGGIFTQLHALNTIRLCCRKYSEIDTSGAFKSVDRRILRSLQKMFRETSLNPTSFPNPINVDFSDHSRTRFYRLYADLILLESLLLADQNSTHYAKGRTGTRVAEKLIEAVGDVNGKLDTTGHRLSYGFLYAADDAVATLALQELAKNNRIARVIGWFNRNYYFGVQLEEEVLMTVVPFVLVCVPILIWSDDFKAGVVGFSLARVAAISAKIWKHHQRNKL